MNNRQKWKNYLDFDEPSGPSHVVPSVPSPQQSESRSWMESMLWMFRRHKSSTQITGQVDSIPDYSVKNSYPALKADYEAPIAKVVAARGGRLDKVLKYRLSTLILGGMAGLVLFLCVQHGLSLIKQAAHQPSYPLFDLVNWDEMQRDMKSLHSMVQSERFSNSEQIQASVEQVQTSMHQCRFLIEDVSIDLGIDVMEHMREWVFGGKCTSALPVVVRRSHGKTQRALDCIHNTNSTLATAMHQIQEAQSGDKNTLTVILARHSSPLSRASPEQTANDDERLNATRKSLSNLTSIHSHLMIVTKGYQVEHKRLTRLNEDMGRLDHLFHHSQEGAIPPEGSMQEENHTATWDCQDFDIPGLRDSFLTLALTIIEDEEKIRQFQSRYYFTSLDSKA